MYTDEYKTKILSFASIFWFAPVIHFFINIKNFNIKNQSDIDFIKHYILIWYLNIIYIFLMLVSYILFIFTNKIIFHYIANYWIIIFFIIFAREIISVFNKKKILEQKISDLIFFKTNNLNINDIIKLFLPWSNFYFSLKWLKSLYLKESILLRSLVIISYLFLPIWISKTLFFIIIFRIIILFLGYDFISLETSKKLDKLFDQNIEEIRWYFVGIILFVIHNIKLFLKNDNNKLNYEETFNTYTNYCKKLYSQYYTFEKKELIVEYLIFIILIINLLYQVIHNYSFFDIYWIFIIIILVSKYILQVKLRKLTLIPIIHEFVHYTFKIFLYIFHKFKWKQ